MSTCARCNKNSPMTSFSFPGKIDKNKLLIEEDEDLELESLDELAETLPENTPRYVVVSYEVETYSVVVYVRTSP